MEGVWVFVKAHWVWFAIGGAVAAGVIIYLRAHSSSSTSQQDLLVAPSTGSGPTPTTSTTQWTGNTGMIQPVAGVSPVSPVGPVTPQVTTVSPSSPVTPISPVSPGGLVTPNIPAPVPAVSPFVQPGISVPPSAPVTAVTPAVTTSSSQQTQSAEIATATAAAASPTYQGTPLGPGTLVVSGSQEAPPQVNVATVTPNTGMNVKIAAANSGKGGLAGNPSMYG